ncbi:MAG: CRTAC1 family protein [Planctomycetota bacterium]|nr:CRTAC1 family protein [Planctomycetota bacterium]
MNDRHLPGRSIIGSCFALVSIGMLLVFAITGCDRSPSPPPADRESVNVESSPEKSESSVTTSGVSIRLRDASIDAGLADVRTTSGRDPSTQIVEVKGGGLGLIDFDQDGDLDLIVPNGATLESPAKGPGARLLRNLSVETGRLAFEDATEGSGLEDHHAWSFGVAVGDVNDDGRDDILIGTLGVDRLWLNQGDGRFADATAVWGLDDDSGWTTSMGLGDLDGDGDLDLVAVGYLEFDPLKPFPTSSFRGVEVLSGPRGIPARGDRWYENLGDRFERRPVGAAARFGLNLAMLDFDGDGRQDVLVGNDSQGNQLHRNLGDWKFEEIGIKSGAATNQEGDSQATMGMAVGDVDGNGTPDVFSTNFSSDTNTLHANLNGFFDDRTRRSGLAEGSRQQLGWATEFADLDHDGDEDVLVVNGHVYPQATVESMDSPYAQPPGLWRRDGKRFVFVDPLKETFAGLVAENPWLLEAHRDRAAVFTDFDLDGDVDVVVLELNGPLRLLENLHDQTDDWVVIQPVPALGAEVRLRAGASTQYRWIRGGGPFQSTASPEAHFGLSVEDRVLPLVAEVRWPDGVSRTVAVQPGTRTRITRGKPDG